MTTAGGWHISRELYSDGTLSNGWDGSWDYANKRLGIHLIRLYVHLNHDADLTLSSSAASPRTAPALIHAPQFDTLRKLFEMAHESNTKIEQQNLRVSSIFKNYT